jgi:hypothetical protein
LGWRRIARHGNRDRIVVGEHSAIVDHWFGAIAPDTAFEGILSRKNRRSRRGHRHVLRQHEVQASTEPPFITAERRGSLRTNRAAVISTQPA